MGARSRSKGRRGEREVVSLARQHGLEAVRTWHTAQDADAATRCCDVRIAGRPAQVKRVASGFSKLYDGLSNVELLFVREDGKPWLAVLDAEKLLAMLSKLNFEIAAQSRMTPKKLRHRAPSSGNSETGRTFSGGVRDVGRDKLT